MVVVYNYCGWEAAVLPCNPSYMYRYLSSRSCCVMLGSQTLNEDDDGWASEWVRMIDSDMLELENASVC